MPTGLYMSWDFYNVGVANAYLAKLRSELNIKHDDKPILNIGRVNERIQELEAKMPPLKLAELQMKYKKLNTPTTRASTAPVQSNNVSQEALTKIQALQGRVQDLEQQLAETTAAAPKALSDAELVALGQAVYGPRHMAALSRNFSGNVAAGVARNLFLDGAHVPGLNTGRLEQQLGKAKPLHGMRRIQAAELQQKIDSWMKTKN